MALTYEPIVGRYATLELGGRPFRIFIEEAGIGIPLLCLHTAGSDSRQYRHLMVDPEITKDFRVIAFDLPWHGKSNPPTGFQDEEYRLMTEGYTEAVLGSPGRHGPRCAGHHGLLDGRADRAPSGGPSR